MKPAKQRQPKMTGFKGQVALRVTSEVMIIYTSIHSLIQSKQEIQVLPLFMACYPISAERKASAIALAIEACI